MLGDMNVTDREILVNARGMNFEKIKFIENYLKEVSSLFHT